MYTIFNSHKNGQPNFDNAELYAIASDQAIDRITKDQAQLIFPLVEKMEKNGVNQSETILRYPGLRHTVHSTIIEIGGPLRRLNFAPTRHKQITRYSVMTLGYQEHLDASHRFHRKLAQSINARGKKTPPHN